jgi:hypothetical protein
MTDGEVGMATRKLSALKRLKRPSLQELADYPGMTSWFEPKLLFQLLGRVITADVFGQYADRRLIEAALDTTEPNLAKRDDISGSMVPDDQGAVWIDFVADLGDGFDSTYAVAYLLAQPTLQFGDLVLPRASALIMGGDEVYPTATRDEYNVKTRAPYQFAFPEHGAAASRPRLLALPGNHDWYDGLVNFLAFFCREKPSQFGNWRTCQRRSYFGVKLAEQTWVWGIDIALVADMDQPQADYFVAIAKAMPQNANVILCSAEPGWYGAEQETNSFRTLSYAAQIGENAGKSIKFPFVLSGDTHHYSRYSSEFGTQYVTAGGGGAFLHGTHQLPEQIHAKWLHEHDPVLSLQHCYPSKEESKNLLWGDLKFPLLNPGFALFLGLLFALFGFTYSMLPRADVAVIEFVILAAGLVGYTGYQEKFSGKVIGLSLLHAVAQFAAMCALTKLWMRLDAALFGFHANGPWWAWLFEIALLMGVVGGAVAGFIFGINLMLTCRYADINHNDAFSAMRLNSFRNFLRIRILGNQVTAYPIGMNRVPERHEWIDNPESASDPRASYFVSKRKLQPKLLEPAIVVGGSDVESAEVAVKKPSELPRE